MQVIFIIQLSILFHESNAHLQVQMSPNESRVFNDDHFPDHILACVNPATRFSVPLNLICFLDIKDHKSPKNTYKPILLDHQKLNQSCVKLNTRVGNSHIAQSTRNRITFLYSCHLISNETKSMAPSYAYVHWHSEPELNSNIAITNQIHRTLFSIIIIIISMTILHNS